MDFDPKNVPAIAKKIYQDSLSKELTESRAAHAKLAAAYSVYIAHSDSELAKLRAQNERLTAETEKLHAEIAALSAQHASSRDAWEAAEQANAGALARLSAELEEQRAAMIALEADCENARAAWKAADEANAVAIASLETQLEEQRMATTAVQAEQETARAAFELARESVAVAHASEIAELTARLEEQGVAMAALQAKREEAQAASEVAQQSSQATLEALSAENEKVHAALIALQTANETLKFEAEQAVQLRQSSRRDEELAACRAVASKCVFIMGFARSNTTLILSMLNCAGNALLLGEADFFLGGHGDNFTAWYNAQHQRFGNQVTKSSYAPNFIPDRPHTWWEWLEEAGKYYDRVGDKIAVSHFHMSETTPEQFRTFHEARFISARYIFALRNPVDVMISSAKLMKITTDADMTRLIIGWLDFMETWADSLRIFPHTMTVLSERFDEKTVEALGQFTDLNLSGAERLINSANRRKHQLPKTFPTLALVKPLLEDIYAEATAATDESRAHWQAEQKRDSFANDTSGSRPGTVAMTSRPLGRVWLKVRELRGELSMTLEAGAS